MIFFLVIAVFKFGHLDIWKTITVSSLKLGQLTEDDE